MKESLQRAFVTFSLLYTLTAGLFTKSATQRAPVKEYSANKK